MSLGILVEIAIGLAFIYMLLGIIGAALQEIIASMLSLRGKVMRGQLVKLLGGDKDETDRIIKAVYDRIGTSVSGLPSYIPSRAFAEGLIDVMAHGSHSKTVDDIQTDIAAIENGFVRTKLAAAVDAAGTRLDNVREDVAKALETWFDDAMDRISGVYKRYSQYSLIIIGLVFAVTLNIDTLQIAKGMWNDQALRDRIVAAAAVAELPPLAVVPDGQNQEAVEQAIANTRATLAAETSALLDVGLPIGWDFGAVEESLSGGVLVATGFIIGKVFGLLFTALATSLGAPFWFDLMQKFLQLRSAGVKPPRADAPKPDDKKTPSAQPA